MLRAVSREVGEYGWGMVCADKFLLCLYFHLFHLLFQCAAAGQVRWSASFSGRHCDASKTENKYEDSRERMQESDQERNGERQADRWRSSEQK